MLHITQLGVDRRGSQEANQQRHTFMIYLVPDEQVEQVVSENRGKSAGEEALEWSVRRRMLSSPASRLTRGAVSLPHTFSMIHKELESLDQISSTSVQPTMARNVRPELEHTICTSQ